MDGPRDCQSEVSQTKTNIMWYSLYVESKKKGTNELMYKTEIELQMQKTNLWFPGSKGGRNKLGDCDWHTHTTTYKTDN